MPVNPDMIATVCIKLIHKSRPQAYCRVIEQINIHNIREKYHIHIFPNIVILCVILFHSVKLFVIISDFEIIILYVLCVYALL